LNAVTTSSAEFSPGQPSCKDTRFVPHFSSSSSSSPGDDVFAASATATVAPAGNVLSKETHLAVLEATNDPEIFSNGQISAAKFHLNKAVKEYAGAGFYIAHNEGGGDNTCLYHSMAQAL
jgi:hypothetical protein